MNDKIEMKLGKVQETLLLPLWGRSIESKKDNPRLIDTKAIEIVDTLNYDFTTMSKNISWVSQLAWVARSIHVDTAIRKYITDHPSASIINIGCGLDTTFERIDNGRITFYELDLPDVIDLRKKFFRESERRKFIASSFLDSTWYRQIEPQRGVLFIAAGVFYYFDEKQIIDFFIKTADTFPGSEVFFDSASPLGVKVANKKVIQDGGMDETAMLRWGIQSAKTIESWDKRLTLVDEYPMFKGFKKGYSFKMKYGLWMSDMLKIMSMVHLKIEA